LLLLFAISGHAVNIGPSPGSVGNDAVYAAMVLRDLGQDSARALLTTLRDRTVDYTAQEMGNNNAGQPLALLPTIQDLYRTLALPAMMHDPFAGLSN
jgi:hypothetical protein